MSGEGMLSSPRWPSARSHFDICECGDYRRDHEGGTGACTFPADTVPCVEPCRRFRLAMQSRAGVAHG